MEDSSRDNSECLNHSRSDNGVLEGPISAEGNSLGQEVSTSVNEDIEASQIQDNPTHSALEQRLHDVPMTVDSPACPHPDEQSPLPTLPNTPNFRLSRSWSCRDNLMTSFLEIAGEIDRSPASVFEKGFTGRPEGLRKTLLQLRFDASTRLYRDGYQSSVGSPSVDELRAMGTPGHDNITSIQSFVAEMKEMVKREYEKQLPDGQVRINHFNRLLYP